MPQAVGVKLLPVAIDVPPVGLLYHFTLVPAAVVTLRAGMVLPVQMVFVGLTAVGAAGVVQVLVHTSITSTHQAGLLPKPVQSDKPVSVPIKGKLAATLGIVNGFTKPEVRATSNKSSKV